MLHYFRLKSQLQNTNTVVTFETFHGTRVDFSKKFLKKDSVSNRWYFTKPVYNSFQRKTIDIVVYLNYGEVYIAECKDSGLDFESTPIQLVQDIVSLKEVNQYRGIPDAEDTNRS